MPGVSSCKPHRPEARCHWLLRAARGAREAALDGRLDDVRLQCMVVQLLLVRLDRGLTGPSPMQSQALIEVHEIMLAVEAALAAQRLEVLMRLEGIACAAEYHDALQSNRRRASQPGFLV